MGLRLELGDLDPEVHALSGTTTARRELLLVQSSISRER